MFFRPLEQRIFTPLIPALAFPPLNYNRFFFALTKSPCAANYTQFPCKVKVEMMQDARCTAYDPAPCFLSTIPCHFTGRCWLSGINKVTWNVGYKWETLVLYPQLSTTKRTKRKSRRSRRKEKGSGFNMQYSNVATRPTFLWSTQRKMQERALGTEPCTLSL